MSDLGRRQRAVWLRGVSMSDYLLRAYVGGIHRPSTALYVHRRDARVARWQTTATEMICMLSRMLIARHGAGALFERGWKVGGCCVVSLVVALRVFRLEV